MLYFLRITESSIHWDDSLLCGKYILLVFEEQREVIFVCLGSPESITFLLRFYFLAWVMQLSQLKFFIVVYSQWLILHGFKNYLISSHNPLKNSDRVQLFGMWSTKTSFHSLSDAVKNVWKNRTVMRVFRCLSLLSRSVFLITIRFLTTSSQLVDMSAIELMTWFCQNSLL